MIKFAYHPDMSAAPASFIFVFGSNLAGVHGAGAARAAHQNYGAVWGPTGGEGLQGQSYAIPTKDEHIETRSMADVVASIKKFVEFTHQNPTLQFWVTRVGCGLAGLRDQDIAPLFKDAKNCNFPEPWIDYLEEDANAS